MKLINDDIEKYFITCGLQELYNKIIAKFRNENYDELYISHFLQEFTNKGVLRNHDYICKHCYEIIRSKKKNCKTKTNNNKTV